MCDPVSIGLTLAGSAISAYGRSQVARQQNKDIAATAAKYEAEKLKQGKLTAENEATVGKTLDLYGKPNQDKMTNDAVAARSAAYVAPIQNRQTGAATPKDFDPNNVIAARNAVTNNEQQAKSITEALAKAKLDAYGDVQTKGRIGANDNSQAIDMVKRIQGASAAAAGEQQAVLPALLKADQDKGQTAGAIGDIFTAAGSLTGMAGGVGSWGTMPGIPAELNDVMAARYGSAFKPSTGLLGGIQRAYTSPFSVFGTAAKAPISSPILAPIQRLVQAPAGY